MISCAITLSATLILWQEIFSSEQSTIHTDYVDEFVKINCNFLKYIVTPVLDVEDGCLVFFS